MKESTKQTILNALSIQRIINPKKKIRIFKNGGIVEATEDAKGYKLKLDDVWERQFESMPPKLLKYMAKNNILYASPYNYRYAYNDSGSYYDTPDKTWDYTPENSLRVSDHWNFTSYGKTHCITDIDVQNNINWTVAKWIDGRYMVIATYPKTYIIRKKKEERKSLKNDWLEETFIEKYKREKAEREEKERIDKLQKKYERQRKRREKALKEGRIEVTFEHNLWGGTSRHPRFLGTETITGILDRETPKTIVVDGKRYKQFENYKEEIIK